MRILLTRLYIGTYMGVSTYLHWTIFLLFGLFYLLGKEILVLQYVILLTSVMIHELGHCYFAQKYGMKTSSITLSPIGGIAHIDMGMPKPVSEFVITAAGPLTSLALALIALPVWRFSAPDSLAGIFSSYFLWFNLVIFIFNLIPAFPLDGGRILRSILHWKSGNILWSTKIAVTISKVLCIGMMALAAMYILPGLLFVGWAMYLMGEMELKALEEMSVVFDDFKSP